MEIQIGVGGYILNCEEKYENLRNFLFDAVSLPHAIVD